MRALALAALVALAAPQRAGAHALDEGTARITLRDGHLEVVAEWDLFRLVEVPPTELATASEDALRAEHERLEGAIETGARLRVDGRRVPLELTGWPSPGELRAIAAQLSAAGEDHGARVRMRLEARDVFSEARHVALAVPARLGPVVVSFVQPAAQYTLPGESATFEVLRRASSEAPIGTSREPWLGALGAALALVAGLGGSALMRRVRRA